MIRIRNFLPFLALLAGVAILGAPTQARANFTIDFDVPSSAGGSISYPGGTGSGTALTGTNITVDSISAPGSGVTPLTVTGGLLNFATGNAISQSGGTTVFDTTGSSIKITATSTSPTNFSGTLLNGVLTGQAQLISVGGGVFEITETAVFTPTSPTVAAYFGDPTGVPYVGSLVITFQPGSTAGGGAFEGGSNGGFISSGNLGVVPAPAPNSFVLLACGAFCLLGFAGWRRHRLIRSGSIA
jgi:hypothetical protein